VYEKRGRLRFQTVQRGKFSSWRSVRMPHTHPLLSCRWARRPLSKLQFRKVLVGSAAGIQYCLPTRTQSPQHLYP
jgi:hypothetical protein